MQEHFYALYVFTVQSNGGVVTNPYLSTLKTYPNPGDRESPMHPVFCIKMTAKYVMRLPIAKRLKKLIPSKYIKD